MVTIAKDEMEILAQFRKLNLQGQEKVLDYLEMASVLHPKNTVKLDWIKRKGTP